MFYVSKTSIMYKPNMFSASMFASVCNKHNLRLVVEDRTLVQTIRAYPLGQQAVVIAFRVSGLACNTDTQGMP